MSKISNGRYIIDDLYLKRQKKFRLCYSRWLNKQIGVNHYSKFFLERITNAKIFYPEFDCNHNPHFFKIKIGMSRFKFDY